MLGMDWRGPGIPSKHNWSSEGREQSINGFQINRTAARRCTNAQNRKKFQVERLVLM